MSTSRRLKAGFLDNLRISQKVYIAFGAVLALTVALGAFAANRLERLSGPAAEVGQHWLPETRELGALSFLFMRFRQIEAARLIAPADAKVESPLYSALTESKPMLSAEVATVSVAVFLDSVAAPSDAPPE